MDHSFCYYWVVGSFCHNVLNLSYKTFKKLLTLTSYKHAKIKDFLNFQNMDKIKAKNISFTF